MKFLIVDDDENICKILTFYLDLYGQCHACSRASEAILLFRNALETEPFDVVFMDIDMPEMTGHELVTILRGAEETQKVPFHKTFKLVMVSAYDDIKNVTASFFRGHAECFVPKPVTESRILEALRQADILK
ncbi:response regulator [Desulfovibrio inopinatus]|uniref:response regulator n=1 Tax=Desulfovibrio inopinatus TaxID=102109 RepID=UPI00040F40C9|nr:response regulator [Desulfovibrio inopinatus]